MMIYSFMEEEAKAAANEKRLTLLRAKKIVGRVSSAHFVYAPV
jgi:hypothetical protein